MHLDLLVILALLAQEIAGQAGLGAMFPIWIRSTLKHMIGGILSVIGGARPMVMVSATQSGRGSVNDEVYDSAKKITFSFIA